MMTSKQRQGVYIALVALFLISIGMGAATGRIHDQDYLPPPDEGMIAQTPFQALVPALLGFREIMASLLWIKTDDYFHRGEYKPIIRMCRLITTIDPHQIDVYATGAWHMAYNFMDKRLIRAGLEFLEDGVKNNPNIYDLRFEHGYTHRDKTKDFHAAIASFQGAKEKVTTDGKPAPAYVRHQLAHSYEDAGLIDETVRQWEENLALATAAIEEKPRDFTARNDFGVAKKNYEMALWRLDDRRDNAEDRADLQLEYTVTKVAPRKLQIEGTINALDLSRVSIRFRDRNWEELEKLDLDQRLEKYSLEWDSAQVRGGKFSFTLNLNRDPADMGRPPSDIYPLTSEEYELTLQFNPRIQPVFIQDRYGWNGEGLTDDPESLKVDPERAGIVEGKRIPLRYIEKTTILKREDIV